MKKVLVFLTATALLVSPIFVSAEDSGDSDSALKTRVKTELQERQEELEQKKEQVQEEIQVRTEALKAEMEAKRETVRNEVEQRREEALSRIRERLHNFSSVIVLRYEAALNRLEILSERIASRIAKLEEAGIDVTEAQELLDIANLKIETAAASIAAISTVDEIIASNTSTSTEAVREDLNNLRDEMAQAKSDLKDAHAALIDVVVALKPGQLKLETQTQTQTEAGDDNSTTTDDNSDSES